MFDNAMLFIVVCCLPSLLSRETMPDTRGTRDIALVISCDADCHGDIVGLRRFRSQRML